MSIYLQLTAYTSPSQPLSVATLKFNSFRVTTCRSHPPAANAARLARLVSLKVVNPSPAITHDNYAVIFTDEMLIQASSDASFIVPCSISQGFSVTIGFWRESGWAFHSATTLTQLLALLLAECDHICGNLFELLHPSVVC